MAEKIFIADKTTQDAIKVKTDLIGVANPTTGSTTTVMNYLKQLDNKFNASNVVPFNYMGASNGTVCTITGKGFLTHSYVAFNGSGSFGLKITLDGVVIFHSIVSLNQYVTGIVPPSLLHIANNSPYYTIATLVGLKNVMFESAGVKQHPYIYNGTPSAYATVIQDTPIHFKSSMVVETFGAAPSWIVVGGVY